MPYSPSRSSRPFASRPAGPQFNRPYQFNRSARPRFVNPGLKIDVNRFVNRVTTETTTLPYQAEHRFSDFALDQRLKQNIIAKGFETPTPIQDQAIPHLLQDRDVIGIANTGTGKTAAFLIPLINKLLLNPQTKVLIMVPTRELALQIQEELFTFARGLGVRSVLCIGGTNIRQQMNLLRQRPSFVIGTPGRLKDLLERHAFNLSAFNAVVLDEADRMLDMGFIDDMRYLLGLLPKARQSLMFSATFSPQIELLTREFQTDPIRISVQTRATAASVDQDIVRVTESQKLDTLHDLLIKPDFNKVLIFGQTKHGVERLVDSLIERGFKAASIHGNKTQSARQLALRRFKNHEVHILVATDVAARGLDIPEVSHVINFDIPSSYEDYIHRIGRTGRAGRVGKALTFVSHQ